MVMENWKTLENNPIKLKLKEDTLLGYVLQKQQTPEGVEIHSLCFIEQAYQKEVYPMILCRCVRGGDKNNSLIKSALRARIQDLETIFAHLESLSK